MRLKTAWSFNPKPHTTSWRVPNNRKDKPVLFTMCVLLCSDSLSLNIKH